MYTGPELTIPGLKFFSAHAQENLAGKNLNNKKLSNIYIDEITIYDLKAIFCQQ